MTKKLLYIIAIIATLSFTPSLQNAAFARMELNEVNTQQTTITRSGKSIIVSGANGKNVYIYNIVGSIVMTVKVDSAEKRIDISHLAPGIYPVKVDGLTKVIRITDR